MAPLLKFLLSGTREANELLNAAGAGVTEIRGNGQPPNGTTAPSPARVEIGPNCEEVRVSPARQ
jgi:hypothetical protein